MNPWLVLDDGYSMYYDGMYDDMDVEWEEPDDEEFEEPEFRVRRIILRLR